MADAGSESRVVKSPGKLAIHPATLVCSLRVTLASDDEPTSLLQYSVPSWHSPKPVRPLQGKQGAAGRELIPARGGVLYLASDPRQPSLNFRSPPCPLALFFLFFPCVSLLFARLRQLSCDYRPLRATPPKRIQYTRRQPQALGHPLYGQNAMNINFKESMHVNQKKAVCLKMLWLAVRCSCALPSKWLCATSTSQLVARHFDSDVTYVMFCGLYRFQSDIDGRIRDQGRGGGTIFSCARHIQLWAVQSTMSMMNPNPHRTGIISCSPLLLLCLIPLSRMSYCQ
ncbi:hypothetical protein IF1G_04844 [Cordyceps javanica]|uniref:Uncharacterized protein n=1 Tax=Cordyceps javanica TaxID=43265 RepID=A0A545V3H4_9HYPO|nr:hypothetical protein IF1G_04844 [Cordyceps javanica]TQW07560.1 hypothetical protein IF2G_04721 [Cordyceps javanica]